MTLFLYVGIFANIYELWTCWTQVIAVVSAILTRGHLEMDLKIRALRILPMFLWPGLSFVSYSAYRKLTDMRKYHIPYDCCVWLCINWQNVLLSDYLLFSYIISAACAVLTIGLCSVRSREFFIAVFCHLVWEDSALNCINLTVIKEQVYFCRFLHLKKQKSSFDFWASMCDFSWYLCWCNITKCP